MTCASFPSGRRRSWIIFNLRVWLDAEGIERFCPRGPARDKPPRGLFYWGINEMTVFDVRMAIRETEDKEQTSIREIIGYLDEMLDRYKVAHSFVLPTDEEMKSDQLLAYWLYYDFRQKLELTLVTSLFFRIYWRTDKKKLLKAIVNSLAVNLLND
jgi:hypothetical protein